VVKFNDQLPQKINGQDLGTAVLSGSWEDRPGTGDGSLVAVDGDWYRVSDPNDAASYRYSSTIGEWVRPEIYGGSPTLLIRMRGSILPSAEDPAWTHYTSNGGAITTDGTKVTFDAGSTNNKTAAAIYSHDQTHVFHFMQGLVQCTATGPDSGWQGGRIIAIVQHTNFTDYHKHKFHRVVLDTNAATARTPTEPARIGPAPFLIKKVVSTTQQLLKYLWSFMSAHLVHMCFLIMISHRHRQFKE